SDALNEIEIEYAEGGGAPPGAEATDIDTTLGDPPGGITLGPDRALWISSSDMPQARITRMTTLGDRTDYLLPVDMVNGITKGPDGNLWFGMYSSLTKSAEIGRLTPSFELTRFPVPLPTGYAVQKLIAADDGKLWFQSNFVFGSVTTGGAV